MGKLVAPVYNISPRIEKILEFKGYNKKAVIDDGEMRDMHNLSSDEHPCLYQRKPRGIYETGIPDFKNPTAMLVKDGKLAIIADGKFYFDGEEHDFHLSDQTQMVGINTKICFFPEKKYYVVKGSDAGEAGDLNFLGTVGTEPALHDAAAGIYSTPDTSSDNFEVNVTTSTISWSDSGLLDVGGKIKEGDAITVEGWTLTGETIDKKDEETGESITLSEAKKDERISISTVVKSVEKNSITFPDETFLFTQESGEESVDITCCCLKIERSCPELDFVIESNNRLWGVSNKDNTIYACKLGDPRNWNYYQGTSMDSYYAEQGTDGEWTGCAAYSTHLLFFKEDYIHKVYGSKPSSYQIETAQCYALEKGSSKSVQIVNDTVFYKSRLGIMAYSGGTPVLISENFGRSKYTDGVAGTDGIKYFVSLNNGTENELFVYDMERYLWHKEDNVKVRAFAYYNGKLIFIGDDEVIYEAGSDNPMDEEYKISWMAQLGPFDEYIEERKVYSQIRMRLHLHEYSTLKIYISVDDGEWEILSHINEHSERSQYIPIVPRRCNKFAIKLEGTGYCKVESLVRVYRDSTMRKDAR